MGSTSRRIGLCKDVFKPSFLKSIAVFIVIAFAWTNLGIYQAVYAAITGTSQKLKRMHCNNQHRVAGNEGTPSLSLQGAESDEAISQNSQLTTPLLPDSSTYAPIQLASLTVRAHRRYMRQLFLRQ